MRIFLGVLLAALLAGCAAPAADQAGEGRDAQRIVTLNGTLTEVVSALGLGDRIVATDVTSTFPEAVNALPKLGHDKQIRAEGILSLTPDLVLANEGQLEPAVEGQLRQAGVRLMRFSPARSIAAAQDLIRQVADSLGRAAEAEQLVRAIEQDLQAVEPLPEAPKVLFIYSRGGGALLVAGQGTPIDALITLAGGRNAVTGFTDFKPLTPEALVAANPDVVLLFSTSKGDLQGSDALMDVPGVASTAAGQAGAFIALDPVVMAGFGPRAGEAVAVLNQNLRAAASP